MPSPSICAPHGLQQVAQVDDLRFDGRPDDGRFSLGQHGGAKHVGRARDGWPAWAEQPDRGAAEAIGAGHDIAVFDPQIGPQRGQPGQVQIDGPVADGASAGQRDDGPASPCQQRAQHAEARPHAPHEFVVGADRPGIDRLQQDRPIGRPRGTQSKLPKQRRERPNVGQPGAAIQANRPFGEDRGGHHRQRRVLRAGRPDRTAESQAAVDRKVVHGTMHQG